MISKKARSISPSITLEISAKVKMMKSEGVDIINLSIGEPDFFTPEKAKKAGIEAIEKNITKYDVASGNLELKKAIVKKLERENHINYETDQIVVSNGAKHAITNAVLATVDPGDEVIIPSPCWVSYPEIVKLAGAVPVIVPAKKENSFKLTVDDVKDYINEKTRMVILTNPSNPTGAVFTKDELLPLCKYFADKNIVILADEIYETIVYDFDFVSIASLSQKIYENTIIVNGLSKSASMTGWRVGYTASSKEIAKAISSIQSHMTAHPCTISQQAAISALNECGQDVVLMRQTYRKRKDMIVEFFKKWAKLDIVKPQGAFYIFIDISPLKDKFEKGRLSLGFCSQLLEKEKVALVPGAGFFNDDYVRLSYAASDEQIKKGLERIKHFVENL